MEVGRTISRVVDKEDSATTAISSSVGIIVVMKM
jgi:hypothetical protein